MDLKFLGWRGEDVNSRRKYEKGFIQTLLQPQMRSNKAKTKQLARIEKILEQTRLKLSSCELASSDTSIYKSYEVFVIELLRFDEILKDHRFDLDKSETSMKQELESLEQGNTPSPRFERLLLPETNVDVNSL